MELFRVLKNKRFVAAALLLFMLNCALFFVTQQKNIENLGTDVHTYSDVFSDNSYIFSAPDAKDIVTEKNSEIQVLKSFADAEKMKAENAQEYEYFAEEEAALISAYPLLYSEYQDGKYSDKELSALTDFYAHFEAQAEYQSNYQSYIDSIEENSRELTSKRLFSDRNSFSYKSILKTAADFSENRELPLSPVNDIPVSSVLNYNIGDFILILLCVFLVISFTAEKNVNLLINTCRSGKSMLKLKQLPLLLLFSLFSSFLIYISEILIAFKIYNAPLALSAPIQSSELFSNCVLHISFSELFAVHIFFKALVAVMTAALIWLLISLSNNVVFVSGIAGLIVTAELLLYKNVSEQSRLSFLKSFNIFSLFNYECITQYDIISFFSVPVRAEILIWLLILFLAFVLSVSVIISAKRNYPISTPLKVFAFIQRMLKRLNNVYSKILSVVYDGRFETFKIMHVSKGTLIAVAFLLIIGLGFNTNSLVFSPTEAFLNDYYEEHGGELSSDVYDSINKMRSEAQAVESEFNAESEQFDAGKISFEEYGLAKAKNAAYDTQRKAAEVLNDQISRIETLPDKGIEPVLINETGYNNLFSSQSNQSEMLLLLCVTVLMFSSAFYIEKASNMMTLNHCAKNGREHLYFKKILAVVPKTFVLTAISYLSVIIQTDYLYNIDYLNADIHNLQMLQGVDLNISIFDYLIINFLFEFLFVTVAAFILASLSAFVSQFAVIVISGSLFVLPSALYMVNISPAKELSASYLFNFNSLVLDKGLSVNTFVIHFVLIIACIVMLLLCNRKWCLTKDR